MRLDDRTYARLIAGAKIGLPLLALGLLSTLFLFARTVNTTPNIPFSDVDLRKRLQDQVLTAPYYAGTTEDGAAISFQAVRALPDNANEGRAYAEDVMAEIRTRQGAVINVTSGRAVLDDRLNNAELSDSVEIQSSTGYVVETDSIVAALGKVHAKTNGPISGFGPPGRFSAGGMLLTSDPAGAVQMVFTDGIKLLYDPAKQE